MSFEVRPQNSHHLLQISAALVRWNVSGTNMFAEMPFQNLGHEAIHGATDRGDLLQRCVALRTSQRYVS